MICNDYLRFSGSSLGFLFYILCGKSKTIIEGAKPGNGNG